MNESLTNFDLNKLITIVHIDKDNEGNWIYTSNDNKQFFLPKDKAGIITKIDDNFASYINSGKPITKYFETDEGNVITYAANFAVDAICLNEGRVYLIERKDGRGWAIPGGFIDAGETAEQAVRRELSEETLAKPEDIKSIEPLGVFRTNDPREINFFSYPFVLHIKGTADLKFGDDAINGKWLLLNRAIKSKLAFTHHNDFLKKVDF
jgi:ADP-ribose pyrophosphatase YjhB (NUDIX family)